MKIINMKELHKQCIDATNQIRVGKVYFLSIHHDMSGVYVEVLEKSTKLNRAGLPSTVKYRILKQYEVPAHLTQFYTIGSVSQCNATNLYEDRELASPINKFRKAA